MRGTRTRSGGDDALRRGDVAAIPLKVLTFITYILSFLASRTCLTSVYILRSLFFGLRLPTHLALDLFYRI